MLFPSISLDFMHFQCYADSAVPSVQKKLGLIYFQLRNYEPKRHSSMILTSFAGLGSWSGKEVTEWQKGRQWGFHLQEFYQKIHSPVKTCLQALPSLSASVWPCVVVKFPVKGSTYLSYSYTVTTMLVLGYCYSSGLGGSLVDPEQALSFFLFSDATSWLS